MNCPHCKATLIDHGAEGPKAGRKHCNDCGCCFLGKEMAPGHPACLASGAELATAPRRSQKEPAAAPETQPSFKGGKPGVENPKAPEDSGNPERREEGNA